MTLLDDLKESLTLAASRKFFPLPRPYASASGAWCSTPYITSAQESWKKQTT